MWIALAALALLVQTHGSDYERALALARAGALDEAEAILTAAREADPSDKRFSIELAGIAFKKGELREARRNITHALRIDPGDPYATEFLATVYFLENNIEASLKYWNRIGQPKIDRVRADPPFRIDPVLWDRAFAFSPASVLSLEDFRATRARLESLDLLSRTRFDLVPSGETMDIVLHPVLRGGATGGSHWSAIAGAASRLPYRTIELDFLNLRATGINISTLIRWDREKRRAEVRMAGPLRRDPRHRFEVALDGRHESWALTREEFVVRRLKGSAAIQSQVNERWSWKSGLNLSGRRSGGQNDRDGLLLTYEAGVRHRMLSVPEARLTTDLHGSLEFGRRFSRTTGMAVFNWLPRASTDDYETTARFRLGRISGDAPFDELFTLGLDRDHDLLLRGHPGTEDGRKGRAPVGSRFLLWNIDMQKVVARQGLFSVRAGPFLDLARVSGENGYFADAGIQVRVSLLNGLALDFSIGRDLRTGQTAVFYRSRRE